MNILKTVIRGRMVAAGVDRTQVAKFLGTTPQGVSNMFVAPNPRRSTIDALAGALWHADDLGSDVAYLAAGYLPPWLHERVQRGEVTPETLAATLRPMHPKLGATQPGGSPLDAARMADLITEAHRQFEAAARYMVTMDDRARASRSRVLHDEAARARIVAQDLLRHRDVLMASARAQGLIGEDDRLPTLGVTR